jgi:hypothetical protein
MDIHLTDIFFEKNQGYFVLPNGRITLPENSSKYLHLKEKESSTQNCVQ